MFWLTSAPVAQLPAIRLLKISLLVNVSVCRKRLGLGIERVSIGICKSVDKTICRGGLPTVTC